MEFNLADLFESVADAVADREAVVCGDRRLTYAQLDERATRLAHALERAGIRAGDHVGLLLCNSTEYLEGMLAAFKIRAVPINVNFRYVEDELHYVFDNADLVALIHQRAFAERVAALAPKLPKLRHYFVVEDGTAPASAAPGARDYEAELARSSAERVFPQRSGDDLYIVYTGGTTGMPKGVMWRQEDIFFAALMGGNPYGAPPERPEQVAENARHGPVMTVLPVAPLMHAAAQWTAFIYLLSGSKLVLLPGPRFDPHRVWRAVEEEKVQVISIVGDAMARPLAEALESGERAYDTQSVVAIGSGGALFSESVKEQLRKHLPKAMILDTFGGSEGGNQGRSAAGASSRDGPRFQADETTAVLDENLRPLPPGSDKVGWLARKGRIPLGYYKDEEKTARTFVEVDGTRWVLPGDMARVEADGTITLLGRGSTCINTGGEKVFPEEVEAALRSHPKVFDAVVVGVPDERFGERVAAVVAARAGSPPTLEELQAHCRARIAGYKLPRELHLVERIERQPSGKPDYRWAKAVATGERGGPASRA